MENKDPNEIKCERINLNGMNFEIRPSWKSTEIDNSKYKLSPKKQLEKQTQRISKNYYKASLEYRNHLESLRTNKRAFLNFCRSLSPIKNTSKNNEFSKKVKDKSLKKERNRDIKTSEESHSLPPNFKEKSDKIDIKKDSEDVNNHLEKSILVKDSIENDIYLTNLRLQTCIKKYTRNLCNICRLLDMDSEDDFYDEDSEKENEVIEEKVVENSSIKIDNSEKKQPQILFETLGETNRKWSDRLREKDGKYGLTNNSDKITSSTKLSKATYSRMNLKERFLNTNLNYEFTRGRNFGRNCDFTGEINRESRSTRDSHPNIIVSSDSRILKQSFTSLFNI